MSQHHESVEFCCDNVARVMLTKGGMKLEKGLESKFILPSPFTENIKMSLMPKAKLCFDKVFIGEYIFYPVHLLKISK